MVMSNDEIMNEFNDLFGAEADEETPEETPTDEDVPEEEEEFDDSEEEDEETEEDSEEESEEEPEETPEDKRQAKQNYAFAQQRQQIKAQEKFIKGLGKLIGMENASTEDIQSRLQEVLLEKQRIKYRTPLQILSKRIHFPLRK